MDFTQNVNELRQQKGQLWTESEQILTKAAEEKRDLKKEEEDKFDAIHGDMDRLDAQIKRLEKQESSRASLEVLVEREDHRT
jgi:uncharacterized protein YdcH (DUF465 family)